MSKRTMATLDNSLRIGAAKALIDNYKDENSKTYLKIVNEIQKDVRCDGRKFDECRPVEFWLDGDGTKNNYTCLTIGQTKIVCGVSTSVVKPPSNAPDKGIIDIEVRFADHCGSVIDEIDKLANTDFAREAVKKVLFHSNFVDLESLCLVSRKHVHQIEIEIIVFQFDGALAEGALLSAVGVLSQLKLPKFNVDDELEIITPVKGEHVQLNVGKNIPTFATFSMLEDNLYFDPNWVEERGADKLLRIALDPESADADCIYFFETVGSSEFTNEQIKLCFEEAKNRGRSLKKVLANHIEQNMDTQ